MLEKRITADTALQLEKVLGIEADFWLGLQTQYDLTLALNKQRKAI